MVDAGPAALNRSGLESRLSGKNVVVIAPSAPGGQALCAAVADLGATVHQLNERDADELMSESGLDNLLQGWDQVDGVVNLLGLLSTTEGLSGAETAHKASRKIFHVARALQRSWGGAPSGEHFFVTFTHLGGGLGHGGKGRPSTESEALLGGAMAGFTKSLVHEWSDATVRVVDLQEGLLQESPLSVLTEALVADGPAERGLLEGRRMVADLSEEVKETTPLNAGAETRWLLTGGGRGITARVALSLAERFGGGEFVLTGRTPLTMEDAAGIDLSAERARLKKELKATGERVTPMQVARALRPLEAQKEIATTLESLRALGARARYLAFDVSDATATERALSDLGNVDVCIHGAGLEDSRLLADKDPETFDRVFAAKVYGTMNLLEAFANPPQAMVVFTSVAGRFGNAGQVDYAASNDAVSRLMASLSTSGITRGLSIDWTAWADVGMATRGSIQTVLESIGVEMLPPEIGAPMVGGLLARGVVGEVVASGALGAMEDVMAWSAASAPAPVTRVQGAPLLSSIVLDGDTAKATVNLDPTEMSLLNDHRIDGTAVLPGVFGMEIFAQTARALSPDIGIRGFEEVIFDKPVKVHEGRDISVEVDARLVSPDRMEAELYSVRTLATGRTARTRHFAGQILLGPPHDEISPFEFTTDDLASRGPRADEIYQVFFHTGSFRILESIPYGGSTGLVAIGRRGDTPPAPGVEADGLLTDPLVREAAFQAAGLHGMARGGHMHLPAGVKTTEIFGHSRAGEDWMVRVIAREGAPEHHVRYDCEVWTRTGRLLQRLEGLDMVDAGPLPEGREVTLRGPRTVLSATLSSEEAARQLEALDLRLDQLVTMPDLEAYHRQKSERRRGEWLAARMAVKGLAGDWLQAQYGVRPTPDALLVVKDEHGAPSLVVRGDFADRFPEARFLTVSLTHSDNVAMAALAVNPQIRIGIDIEKIAPRPDAFADTWLDASERVLEVRTPEGEIASEDARITALWCLMEATTKALGLGFNLAVSEVIITQIDPDGTASLAVYGRAAERLVHLGGQGVRALVRIDPRFAIAESIVELSGEVVHEDDPQRIAAVAALLREKGLLVDGRQAASTDPQSVN